MDEPTYFLCLAFISLFCVFPSSYCKEDVCVKKTPCRCEFSNGTWIDLTPSAKNTVFTSETIYQRSYREPALTTFYYHPCYDISMAKITNLQFNTCNNPASLCRSQSVWNETAPDTLKKMLESYEFIGSSSDSEFASDGSYIVYRNRPSETYVHLVCAQSDDRLAIKDLSQPNRLELLFYSRNACLSGISNFDFSSWNVPLIQIACRVVLNTANSTTTTAV